jgi:hypothetical protein
MTERATSEITLRALQGRPLADEKVRGMVVATAQAIAERQGVRVLDMATAPDHIRVKLNVGRIESLGFAAELRRLTSAWYAHKFRNQSLWGDAPVDDAS